MKQRLYRFRVLVAVLTALLLIGPAVAAGKQVPFKGRSSGVVTTVSVDPVAALAYTHVRGEGHATHLGHFTQVGDATVDLLTGAARGTWTLIAANGDMLFLTMEAYGVDPLNGVGSFTITGGTGRFAGATGSYEQIIVFDSAPGASDAAFTDTLTGTISLRNQ